MKKILIAVVFLILINMSLLIVNILVLTYGKYSSFGIDDFRMINNCDTVINKLRIDSIEYIIKSKDSIINRIKYDEQEYNEKINNLSDTASVELFKRLVSE